VVKVSQLHPEKNSDESGSTTHVTQVEAFHDCQGMTLPVKVLFLVHVSGASAGFDVEGWT
jgi:hypothetical protein